MSLIEIDALATEFFGAFDNRAGRSPDVARLRRLLLPQALVVVTHPQFAVLSVEEFIEPRRRLLTGGRLVDFSEWETSARTDHSGDLATRFSEYAKSGTLDGSPYGGTGSKTFQLVRTPGGWRIASLAWQDHP